MTYEQTSINAAVSAILSELAANEYGVLHSLDVRDMSTISVSGEKLADLMDACDALGIDWRGEDIYFVRRGER